MKKPLLATLAALGVAALVAPVTPAAALNTVDSGKLRQAVTVNGILEHERALYAIATKNDGNRASGTAGYEASVKYVTKKLKQAGFKVKTQTFEFPTYEELAPSSLSEVSPTAGAYESATVEYSGSGDVTGTLVVAGGTVIPPAAEPSSASGCEPGDFPAAPSGPAVALVQRGTCNFAVKVENAQAAGYDAVVLFNEGQPGRDELLTGVTLGTPVTIPVVGVSYATGAALAGQVDDGAVSVRVTTSTRSEIATTKNVLADTPKGRTGTTVVVGAHLDSVLEGPGINDNGSGTSTILEIAEQMKKLGYTKKGKLQRQVRFAFWGAEEAGLLGSEAYVASLSPEQISKIYANLNFDMLGSPNYVRFVYDGDGSETPQAGPAGSAGIEKIFDDYFASQGLETEPTAFDGRSDYGPFIAAGIPAGGLFSGAEGEKTEAEAATYGGTAGEAYDPCYHQACDDVSNVNAQALFELGDAAAHATFVLATSKSGIYPDGSRVAAPGKRVAKAAVELPYKGAHAVR
ncbi:PA domain-containing protein [Microlunatus sagamiharensis]|uniref:PA domain-containing protein n=1 Tax=Microlunatus sagamiharensis TaxID=546874 RepID=A0A1H2N3D9_9ACTN|nr:M20/M25/M40 family metallo-hydrolase [Microlunatus sagamiharensis]SDU99977.1 PA domain-containing protein [Microlunatus sagamiharensis]